MKSCKDVENDFESYITKISTKFTQLKNLGVDTFCVLYDDIPLAYTALEGKMSGEALEYARVQCLVVNAVQKSLGVDCNLWFCSSEYFFIRENLYTKILNKYLDKKIALIWTGNKVFTKKITESMLIKAKEIVSNRELIWWDNYPVNDPMSAGFLNLGGFNEPNIEVLPCVKGILVNPVREVSPNIPYLLSFSKYLTNPSNYNRKRVYTDELGNYYNIDDTIVKIILEFSSRSEIDRGMKYGYKKLREINTDEGRRCLLKDLKISYISIKKNRLPKDFKLLISQIFASTLPSQKRVDYFPVPVDATYLNRILLIVLLRLLLDLKAQRGVDNNYRTIKTLINKVVGNKLFNSGGIDTPSVELSLVCSLYNKFLNINKVELNARERKDVEIALLKLIARENSYFVETAAKLSKIGKLRAFSLRLNINQYRIKSLLTEIDRFKGDF